MAYHARTLRLGATALALSVTLVAAGCAQKGPAYVDSGSSYTKSSLVALFAKADTSKLTGQPTSSATSLRHQALVGLRARGGSAAIAADLITKTFPTEIQGVPVYIEQATIDSSPTVIVIEAIGPEGGRLASKRLWALSPSGDVLFVASR